MEAALCLIATADIVSENFKPGTMKKLGLDYETLQALNPRLIYVSHKGFLPGPYDHRTALDEVVQMMGGLAYMTGRSGDPLRAGASVNDIMGAMAALRQRELTGLGTEVQSALFENNVFLVGQHMMQFAATGHAAAPMPSRISAWAVYDVFTVLGGEQIFLAVVSDKQWVVFCRAFGLDEMLADPRLKSNNDRVLARDWMMPILRSHLAGRSVADLSALFEATELPFAPITRPEELFDDPHLNATGGLAPVRMNDGSLSKVPLLGEHSSDLLRQAGYSTEEINALKARRIIKAD